jgi:GxxExxY protein
MGHDSERGSEKEAKWLHADLTEKIIGAAIDVHRVLGPGLLESCYERCLLIELQARGLACRPQVELPVVYKEHAVDCAYRIDMIVDDVVLLEIKSVESILPIHEAQMLTYLKLSGIRVGLLMNFNVEVLKEGIRRRIV